LLLGCAADALVFFDSTEVEKVGDLTRQILSDVGKKFGKMLAQCTAPKSQEQAGLEEPHVQAVWDSVRASAQLQPSWLASCLSRMLRSVTVNYKSCCQRLVDRQ